MEQIITNQFKLLRIIGIIGLGTLSLGSLYFIYKKFFEFKNGDNIQDYLNLSLQDIKAQIEDANGIFDEDLKKKIFLKVNQTHEKVMKIRFDVFIEKNNLSATYNVLSDEIINEFLKENWGIYKSTTDYILTKIGITEKEYCELFSNMSLKEYMDYEYEIENKTIFQGREIFSREEAKIAFLDYIRITETYLNRLNNKVNKDNSNSFDEELQLGVLFSNIKIETQIYLKYKFTPKELLYMIKKYNLLNDDPEVSKAYDNMMKNSPNFHRV